MIEGHLCFALAKADPFPGATQVPLCPVQNRAGVLPVVATETRLHTMNIYEQIHLLTIIALIDNSTNRYYGDSQYGIY